MKPLSPQISVVLPFSNSEETLKRSICSILNQTYTNFELILVNNNSNDRSVSIALSLACIDRRIVILNEYKKGLSYAANTGYLYATGKYIARMDATDFSYPTRLEKQVDLLENSPSIGVASCLINYCQQKSTNEHDKFVEWINSIQTPRDVVLNRFIENPVINTTVLFRRELLTQMGNYLQGGFPEDYELWLRWISAGVKIQKVPEVLIDWYKEEGKLTLSEVSFQNEIVQLKTDYLLNWLKETDNPYLWVWGASNLSRQKVSKLEEHGIFIEGYIDEKELDLEDAFCIHFNEFNWDASSFILSYIDNLNARENIRDFLKSKGKIEGVDFILVA